MQGIWLLHNPASAGSDAQTVAQVKTRFREAGRPIHRTIDLSEGGLLPDSAEALADGVGLIVTLTGDGTLSALADRLDAWPGALLALPGGTMNLLAHALHGEADIATICEAAIAGRAPAIHIPTLVGPGVRAYAGILAGPTAMWRDVREAMRDRDLAAIAADVPRALAATLAPAAVRLEDRAGEWTAIYMQPGRGGIALSGIRADGVGDLAAHGLAWARGDFRTGPHDALGDAATAMIHGPEGDSLSLLVDGEPADAPNPAAFFAGRSLVRFHALRGLIRWD